ncbi:MAG: YdcF family protein [Oscillospiraceae bacterium]|jgi:vancomycin permeability regulator SanA|nr:YdcF family protein [Oscillospiraceae bacterium]
MAKQKSRKELRQVMTSRRERQSKRRRARIAALLLGLMLLTGVFVGGINVLMAKGEAPRILSQEQAAQLSGVDCILVLGAKVLPGGAPSHMLEDRCRRGVALWQMQAAPVLLMSGDHGQVEYDEVSCMKRYAVERGVPSSAVFMDHAGFSTYDSLYRARDIFGAKRIIIVTQRYHMFRALYTARKLGLDAYGVTCDYRAYQTKYYNALRELLARVKAWFQCAAQPQPVFLGDPIPLSQSGDITNDEGSVFPEPG